MYNTVTKVTLAGYGFHKLIEGIEHIEWIYVIYVVWLLIFICTQLCTVSK